MIFVIITTEAWTGLEQNDGDEEVVSDDVDVGNGDVGDDDVGNGDIVDDDVGNGDVGEEGNHVEDEATVETNNGGNDIIDGDKDTSGNGDSDNDNDNHVSWSQ